MNHTDHMEYLIIFFNPDYSFNTKLKTDATEWLTAQQAEENCIRIE